MFRSLVLTHGLYRYNIHSIKYPMHLTIPYTYHDDFRQVEVPLNRRISKLFVYSLRTL